MLNDDLLARIRLEQERRALQPSSIEKREIHLRAFMAWLGRRSILTATREDVETFLDGRGIGAKTRYCWLTHLSAFYAWAIDEGLCKKDPTSRIVRPKLRRSLPRPAPTADLHRALELAPPMMKAWLLLAAYEGMRCAEIAGMRREDVIDGDGLIRVTHAKGGNERMLPLHPEVAKALADMPMPRKGWIFVRPDIGGRFLAAQVSKDINAYLRFHQVPATAHQLRHWFGTHLYQVSHDLRITQEMLGHANPATTAGYAAFDHGAAADAVQTLTVSPPDEAA